MKRELLHKWRHVVKLDPAKEISQEHLEMLIHSGTDAIIVGGTDNITYQNTNALLSHLSKASLPLLQEVSTIASVHPDFDGYLIPSVLHTSDVRWIIGEHQRAIKLFGDFIPWEKIFWEGYVIGNPEAKVAIKTGCDTALSPEDVRAYARLVEHVFHFPIFYVEYSGTYGGTRWLRAAREVLQKTVLLYGGGIQEKWQAEEVAEIADIVVIGNLVYEDIEQACQTVRWVKEVAPKKGLR